MPNNPIQLPLSGPGSASTIPPFPEGATTPNLGLSLNCPGIQTNLNFQELDTLLANVGPNFTFTSSYFKSAGHQQPAIAAVAFEAAVTTANHVNCHLFYLAASTTVVVITMEVGVGQPGATLNAGIYNGATGALLVDSGAMPASTSGAVVKVTPTVGASLVLVPGWYYYAFSSNSTTATFLAMNQNNLVAYYAQSNGTPRNVLASTLAANGALPVTMGSIPALGGSDVVYHPCITLGSN
jgi:hypothetical protein